MDHAVPVRSAKSHRGVVLTIVALIVLYFLAIVITGGIPHIAEPPEGIKPPHLWSVAPFVLLLGAIAVLPLLGHAAHWWESNLNKFYVAVNLALLTLAYIAFAQDDGSVGHAAHTLAHVVLKDYVPFMVLLFSLYTISGGIRIAGDLPAHALTNTTFMLVGGLLASLIGTTGAAMVLIRPLLETNRERKNVAHTAVFFIFIVCNCGGLLLPLGDPPLFLGYLAGVPFLWTLSLWKSWLLINGLLLAVYFVWDHFFAYPRETAADLACDETRRHRMRIAGVWPNGLLLLGVVFCVALLDSAQPFPGTDWRPWPYLREICQLALVAASLTVGPRSVREDNSFDYLAIVEVAALFIGIFICMQPALAILRLEGANLGIDTPAKFFWATGGLSSVLDNAPTYLVFFQAAESLPKPSGPTTAGVSTPLLAGISLGAVCMGTMTYIGNGPNFMVKTIAEKAGVRMPSFFGYMAYSVGVLFPILLLHAWLLL
jgi:Na+/H+ antiporter NhaD/arsenite permease-like protein